MTDFYLYKDKDGNIQRATAGEPVSRDELQKRVDDATAELRQWTDALAQYDKLADVSHEAAASEPTADEPKLAVEHDDGDGHISFKKIPVSI